MAAEYSQDALEEPEARDLTESGHGDHRRLGGIGRIRRWPRPGIEWFPLLTAVGATVSYGAGLVIAYVRFPAPYSPLQHTMSELGNPALNPDGAGFYRVGAVLGGALTSAFFLSLGPWRQTGTPLQNRLLTAVQGLGVMVGAALASFAVFPDNESTAHLVVLGIAANGFAAAVLLSLVALRRQRHPDLTAAALLAVGSVVIMFLMPAAHWAEWLPALMSQIYAWVLAFHTAGIVGHDLQVSDEQISGARPIARGSNRS